MPQTSKFEIYQVTKKTKQLVRLALEEDIGRRDITSHALISRSAHGRAVILVKEKGVLSGHAIVEEIFKTVDRRIHVGWRKRDGSALRPGEIICFMTGPVASILKAERVALNFLGRFSGIATQTRKYVDRVKGTGVKIYDTRKTIPLWRRLEKHSVRMGGGSNHRMGLWDEGFIKDNHWRLVENPTVVAKALKRFKHRKWTVEVAEDNLDVLPQVLEMKPDVLLLDNFSPRTLKRITVFIRRFSKRFRKKILIEASGGIDLKNVRRFAQTGVDRISIGALTHSVRAIDFSLEVEKLN